WPFDGVFVAGARDRASDGGFVAYTLRPIRNVQVRLRLASDHSVVSQPTTVWVDFASTIVRRGGGGPRPRVRATLFAPREAEIRRKAAHAYLLRPRWDAWRRVGSSRWPRRGRLSASVTFAYPRGTLGRRDRVLVCTRERVPDGFGEPTPYDPLCGARRLPRSLR
ncbi:MAG TPA: hypothetical protein VGW10_09405, partial [Solirubrobacteraceae bacterium]|nr:hypothetical protein [Solirubrobacteraceae bacterium]